MWLSALISLASASPDTVYLQFEPRPDVSDHGLWSYHDGQFGYLLGPMAERIQVSRAGFQILFDEELVEINGEPISWTTTTPYRRDRGPGFADTLVRGLTNGDVVDVLHPSDPPLASLVPGGQYAGGRPGDVDGDGTEDFITSADGQRMVLLMSSDRPRLAPFPANAVLMRQIYGARWHVMPDLNRDGHAEIWDFIQYADIYDSVAHKAEIAVYNGGPDGFEQAPRFTLTLDGAPLDVVAVQADDDPELEILVFAVDLPTFPFYIYPFLMLNPRLILIDDTHTSSPTQHSAPSHFPTYRYTHNDDFKILRNLGDVDADGLDDVLLNGKGFEGQMPDPSPDFKGILILSSVRGYDVLRPIASFLLGPQNEVRNASRTAVDDIDRDGHVDILALHARQGNIFQVWFGPLAEPTLPDPEPHTGHTGTTPAEPTTPSEDTATPSQDSATTPAPPPPAPAKRCASATGAPVGGLLLLAALAALRRRRAP